MNDLRFIIVNSHLLHSQLLVSELQNRVSFDVYQDTKEKNIWGLMDGGKDDIFVYDRCGRLAYYIPFPLSIMSADEGLVPSAILATYYRSPCGYSCQKKGISSLEETLNKLDPVNNSLEITTEDANFTTEFYDESMVSNTTDQSIISFNGNFSIDSEEVPKNLGNDSEHYIFDDFDYPQYNDTSEDYDNNDTNSKEFIGLYNSLYNIYFSNDSTVDTTENTDIAIPSNISLSEFSSNNSNNTYFNVSDHHIQTDPNDVDALPKAETEFMADKKRLDRCAEADIQVCRSWSKKKLLRAHNCCSFSYTASEDENKDRYCRNFEKRRCKKIRPVLKCCIKTAIIDKKTEDDTISTTEEIAEYETTPAMTTAVTNEAYLVVCCKNVVDGQMCRVSQEAVCKNDEYIVETMDDVAPDGQM